MSGLSAESEDDEGSAHIGDILKALVNAKELRGGTDASINAAALAMGIDRAGRIVREGGRLIELQSDAKGSFVFTGTRAQEDLPLALPDVLSAAIGGAQQKPACPFTLSLLARAYELANHLESAAQLYEAAARATESLLAVWGREGDSRYWNASVSVSQAADARAR